ncbi:unnamed protein product [Camellia sinensis]
MECVNPILSIATRLWDCTAKTAKSIHDLVENLKSLENEMEKLKDLTEDVKRKVELEEQRQMTRRKHVDGWLRRVEVAELQMKEILNKGGQEIEKKCLGCCPKNCQSSYKLGKEVKENLKVVIELQSEGHFDAVADRLPRGPVDERPMEKTVVGLDLRFQKVWGWLNDEQVRSIGIFGMGGVGKTTLLSKINNEFVYTNHDFDVVIWVVASKQATVEKVQKVICDKLHISDDLWKNKIEDERAVEIFQILRKKKFLLLLDDVWGRLDLLKVGVPPLENNNKSKVVFTTRSEDVCDYMETDEKVKVECLAREEALDLFWKKVGENTLNSHPDIPKLAERVVEECKGLPLALIAIGRAMTRKNEPRDWERAIEKMKKIPSSFSCMNDDVFRVLKFSYDSLHDDIIRSCFVYCCIYPEDYDILNDDLIEHWIGEGFLDEFDDIYESRKHGHEIIGSLKLACLLELGKSKDHIKMHDVIRDMALWIDYKSNGNHRFLVLEEHTGLFEANEVTKWKQAERILVLSSSSSVEEISTKKRFCPNLRTLFVRHTTLNAFPSGFFQFMPVISTLDLSSNFHLIEVPEGIDKLVTLQYLNLSNTRIKELPVELKNLIKIKYLLLNSTYKLVVIPRQVISSLSLLRVFGISGGNSSSNAIVEANVLSGGRKALLEEVESLEHLSDISITIFDAFSVKKIQNSQKLQRCLSYLCLERCEGLSSLELSSSSLKRMNHLERLDIYYCELRNLEIIPSSNLMGGGYFHNLSKVHIAYCDMLLDLTWLIYAPRLQLLDVAHCRSMKEIVREQNGKVAGFEDILDIFSRLTTICLINLPSLTSIFPRALPFPSLIELRVGMCFRLRKLPFDSDTAKNSLKEIRGDGFWWNLLQWDNETMEAAFRSCFVPEESML